MPEFVAASRTRANFAAVKFRLAVVLTLSILLASCAKDRTHTMRISVADQKLVVFKKGVPIAAYGVSTSKFGLGDVPGRNGTPLGRLEVAKKIGRGAPVGMKFKNRKPTGEVVAINAPGRDPIVTRILRLKGLESRNRRAYARTIYIHGTPEERKIGVPASYGCIRMRSRDVIELFDTVGIGAQLEIVLQPLVPSMIADAARGRAVQN